MDELIDNFPGARKKGYDLLDGIDKYDDLDIFGGLDQNGASPFLNDPRPPENLFEHGPDDLNDLPGRGLDSLDNSVDNIIRPSHIGISYHYDQLDRHNSRHPFLETPRSPMMKQEMLLGSPSNQLAQLYKVTNKTTTIKESKRPSSTQQVMLTEQQIQQFQQQQYSAYLQKLNQDKYQRQQQYRQSIPGMSSQAEYQSQMNFPQSFSYGVGAEMTRYPSAHAVNTSKTR